MEEIDIETDLAGYKSILFQVPNFEHKITSLIGEISFDGVRSINLVIKIDKKTKKEITHGIYDIVLFVTEDCKIFLHKKFR